VSASNYIVYKKSRLSNGFLTTINLLSLFFNTGNVANFMNIIDGSDALTDVNKMICYGSNSKNPSTNPVHKNLFSDFIYNSQSIKKLIFDVIHSFQHILYGLHLLNENDVCFFDISPKNIVFLEHYREKPILRNFKFSLNSY
jgi:hypothetical protein